MHLAICPFSTWDDLTTDKAVQGLIDFTSHIKREVQFNNQIEMQIRNVTSFNIIDYFQFFTSLLQCQWMCTLELFLIRSQCITGNSYKVKAIGKLNYGSKPPYLLYSWELVVTTKASTYFSFHVLVVMVGWEKGGMGWTCGGESSSGTAESFRILMK